MTRSLNLSLVNVIASLFIFLFTYTGITKSHKFELFSYVLSKSSLIGGNAKLVAWSILISESAAILLLIISPLRYYGFMTCAALMALFTGYILSMLMTQSTLPCSCGGILNKLSWKDHLYLNFILTVLAVVGLFLEKKKHSKNLLQ